MKGCKIFFLDHRSNYINSLGDALGQLGHQVFFQSSWRMEEIEQGISHFKPDILITVGCDSPLYIPSIDSLPDICRKYGVFHLYWATEDKIHHERWSLPFVRRVQPDYVWTIHPECTQSYQAINIPASYLNFCFNPRLFPAKSPSIDEFYDISFIGTTHLNEMTYRYDSLRQLLIPLVKSNIRTDIWGYGWEEEQDVIARHFEVEIPQEWIHGFLPYKNTAEIYHKSKIILGVQNALDQVTQRTFEILGAGGFMIASKTPELCRLFSDGIDIVLSGGPEETIELVSYYLAEPEKRQKIGQRAREKVLQNYTYDRQLKKIWPELEKAILKRR
jgi:spore maturation protein CgeB